LFFKDKIFHHVLTHILSQAGRSDGYSDLLLKPSRAPEKTGLVISRRNDTALPNHRHNDIALPALILRAVISA
jgi:hypothetical protein